MSAAIKPVRIIHTDNPVREIWSMLSYFESERNVEEYLKKRFSTCDEFPEVKKSLASTMKAAKEYYTAAESVTILTRPLLLFYGMTALSKVVFMATHGKPSPSTSHGLDTEDESSPFQDYSARVTHDGTFPQFHGCISKQNLRDTVFSTKELLSLIPEIKINYETVYDQKSNALKIERQSHGIAIVDSELEKYGDLDIISKIPKLHERYAKTIQVFGDRAILFCVNHEAEDPVVRAISGEEYLVLPLIKQSRTIALPEMSTHFMIMYLLGMLSRYPLRQWLEIVGGEESGDIYIIQKFLEVTTRKFPNLILSELHDRNFLFTSPVVETKRDLTKDEIYEYVSKRMGDELGRRL